MLPRSRSSAAVPRSLPVEREGLHEHDRLAASLVLPSGMSHIGMPSRSRLDGLTLLLPKRREPRHIV